MSSELVAAPRHFRTIIYQKNESGQLMIIKVIDFIIRHQAISWAKQYNRQVGEPEINVFARVYNDSGEEIFNELSPLTQYPILL